MGEEKRALSLVEKMKLKAQSQTPYGGETKNEAASIDVTDCPNCGAGRAKHEGLKYCAYCGFEFLQVNITDGINLKKEDNLPK
jgi:hypothetical protein